MLKSPKIGRVVAAACLVAGAGSATAANYSFSQDGFAGGGLLTGTFSGVDTGDGVLVLSELSAFALSFAGDTNVPDFTLGLADLLAFSYDLGDARLGDGDFEGLLASSPQYTLISGMAAMGATGTVLGDGNLESNSKEAILVQRSTVPAVPEPSTYALIVLGLAGVVAATRRRR